MIVKTVGRSQENSIVINDPCVGRKHLQLIQDDQGNISVVDLGSVNGTFVNGRRINGETPLHPGDELRVVNTTINWQDYFAQPVAPHQPTSLSSESLQDGRKPIRPWVFVVASVLIMLIIIIVVSFLQKENKDKDVEQGKLKEEIEYRNLERNALMADRNAARAAAEYEEALKLAAMSKSEKNQRKADSLKNIYEKSVRESNRLNQELAEKDDKIKETEREKAKAERDKEEALRQKGLMEDEKKRAEQSEKDAIDKKNKAESARENAERERGEALERAENAENEKKKAVDAAIKAAKEESKDKVNAAEKTADEAKKATKEAKEATKITIEFYQALNDAKDEKRLSEVCLALGISGGKNVKSKYEKIEKEFNDTKDNAKKKEIVKKIKGAKKIKSSNDDND